MANPRRLGLYNQQWLALIEPVAVHGRSVTIAELGGAKLTKNRAHKLRLRFYAFRSLLRKSAEHTELAAIADSVEVIIAEQDDGTAVLQFRNRDMSPEANALRSAIAEALDG